MKKRFWVALLCVALLAQVASVALANADDHEHSYDGSNYDIDYENAVYTYSSVGSDKQHMKTMSTMEYPVCTSCSQRGSGRPYEESTYEDHVFETGEAKVCTLCGYKVGSDPNVEVTADADDPEVATVNVDVGDVSGIGIRASGYKDDSSIGVGGTDITTQVERQMEANNVSSVGSYVVNADSVSTTDGSYGRASGVSVETRGYEGGDVQVIVEGEVSASCSTPWVDEESDESSIDVSGVRIWAEGYGKSDIDIKTGDVSAMANGSAQDVYSQGAEIYPYTDSIVNIGFGNVTSTAAGGTEKTSASGISVYTGDGKGDINVFANSVTASAEGNGSSACGVSVGDHDKANVFINVNGDVTATADEGFGLRLQVKTGTKTDVLVDGTLSGSSVAITGIKNQTNKNYINNEERYSQTNEYAPAEANVYVWKAEENADGEIARIYDRRIDDYFTVDISNPAGKSERQETQTVNKEASVQMEQAIWYIVKVAEEWTDKVTVTATKKTVNETDYLVAHEGDTVILKLNLADDEVLEGIQYNDEKNADYTVNKDGSYTIKMLRGGAMQLGLKLHKHTPGAAVKDNEVTATCTKAGSYDEVVYCTVCKAELSRTAKTVDKLDHIPDEAVKENIVASKPGEKGHYDEVVYCTVCKAELSRKTVETDALPVEEPVVEEPKTEEPTAEEPTTEEPKTEEPTAEEPTTEEPKSEEPTAEEPKTEEPTTEEPATEEPTTEEPKTEEPKTEEPKAEEPKTEEPKTEEPKTAEPKTEEPKSEEPKTEEPKTEEPKSEEPKTEEPKTEEPKTEEPTTEEPKTEKPKAEEPKTEEPTTEEPKAEAPAEPARYELVYEPVSEETEVNGVKAADHQEADEVLKTVGEALEGETVTVTIPGVEKVLNAEEKAKFDTLPVKDRLLVTLSALGFADELGGEVEGMSDEAKALSESIAERMEAMDEAEKQALLSTIAAEFPKGTVTVDGAEHESFSIDLVIERNGEKTYERYTFYEDGGVWKLYGIEKGVYKAVE